MTARTLNHAADAYQLPLQRVPRLTWRGRLFNFAYLNTMRALTPRVEGRAESFDTGRARRAVRRAESIMTFAPEGMHVSRATSVPVPADWVTMPDRAEERVFLFVHSGSFIFGQSKLHLSLAAHICALTRATALAVDYRIAPENPFPAALEDVADAYEWLLEQGRDPSQIQILGDSAGGGIALGALLMLRDRHLPIPSAMTLLAPWADMTMSGRSMLTNARKSSLSNNIEIMMICRELYVQGHMPADPLASPVFADLSGLPPALIQVSASDILLDDAHRIDASLRAARSETELRLHPPMPHGWQRLGMLLPESRRAIEEIGTFMNDRFDAGSYRGRERKDSERPHV